MNVLLSILSVLAIIVNIVCMIIVLIKMAQSKGALHAVLGFFCSIYAFIWGWQNVKPENIRNVMIAWSAAILLSIVASSALTAMLGSSLNSIN